jgi:hypothetical protein
MRRRGAARHGVGEPSRIEGVSDDLLLRRVSAPAPFRARRDPRDMPGYASKAHPGGPWRAAAARPWVAIRPASRIDVGTTADCL